MRQGNVMAWFFLAGAVLLEVTATLSIKAALGQPALYAVVVLGYAGAFMCLTLVLRRGDAPGCRLRDLGCLRCPARGARSESLTRNLATRTGRSPFRRRPPASAPS